jgi:hypothetical protein
MFRGERPSFEGRYYRTSGAERPLPCGPAGADPDRRERGEAHAAPVAKYGDEATSPASPREEEALTRHAPLRKARDPARSARLARPLTSRLPTSSPSRPANFARRGLRWDSLQPLRRPSTARRPRPRRGRRRQREIPGAGSAASCKPGGGHREDVDLCASTLRRVAPPPAGRCFRGRAYPQDAAEDRWACSGVPRLRSARQRRRHGGRRDQGPPSARSRAPS